MEAALKQHPRKIDGRVSAGLRRVPAPPLPQLTGRIQLRYADPDADAALVQGWMSLPHVEQFWQQAWPLERWRAHLAQMYDDTYERPYIGEFHGRDVGYVELYRAARDVVADHYPADAWDLGLHGAIGDVDLVGKNVAYLFWLDVIPAIFRAEPRCGAVVTDPAADHPMAVRLDQAIADRIGGERLPDAVLPHKKAALFRYSRAGAEAAGLLP